jgi:hypothetical protein
MTEPPPYIFKYPLLNRALHFDFLRLRCGAEDAFHKAVAKMHPEAAGLPRTFVAMSEWDAVMILPTRELYPEVLNKFYDNYKIDSTIAGTAGYFAYLWDHAINADLEDQLNFFQSIGVGMITSFRFEDWVRREFGLGAEILFCEYLYKRLAEINKKHHKQNARRTEEDKPGFSAIVAHTLGWNDIVCVLHATEREERLLEMQSEIRLLTLQEILPADCDRTPYVKFAKLPLFAASYTHIIGGYEALINGKLAMGNLANKVLMATLLVRVSPAIEWKVRKEIETLSRKLAGESGQINAGDMPTEMGHYTFSANITHLVQDGYGGKAAMTLLSKIRTFIGYESRRHVESDELFNSYAETTTFFRFRTPSDGKKKLRIAAPDEKLKRAIKEVRKVMDDLPENLRGRKSPMTAHRFGIVLTTLLDHLSDPIRSSVVGHIKRFLVDTTTIKDLDRQGMEDLCQIAEYAMTQATDGLAQFQHDANALGLTGRGGYSRLITAIENYADDILVSFGVLEKDVLITFGLRPGQVGSIAPFHIDIPFNILFVPSRWHIMLHEVGHIAWWREFGWMPESLAMYEEMEAEIHFKGMSRKTTKLERARVRAEFIRTREIIRELFPNLLVYLITCGGDIEAFDRLSMRHILSHSRPGHGTRELLIAVVLNCVLTEAGEARKKGRDWMSTFLVRRSPKRLGDAVQASVASVTRALDLPERERGSDRPSSHTVKNKQTLLVSKPFSKSAEESVKSVFLALRHLARSFESKVGLPHALFDMFEESIELLIKDQDNVENWSQNEEFAQWLINGEVLAVSPGAHVWAKLLHDSRDEINSSDHPAFMISQLATLLSIWHRAEVSAGEHDEAALKVLHNRLLPLRLVKRKAFGSSYPIHPSNTASYR